MNNSETFKKQSYYFFILIFIFYSFKQNHVDSKRNITTINNRIIEVQNQPVIVTGKTDDLKAFRYLNWMNDSYLYGGNHKDISKVIVGDSLYLRLDSLKQSGIMSLVTFGDSGRYRQRLFVTPGDSISIILKNKKLIITGKNKAHYDFFVELGSLNLVDISFNGNLNQYKKECKDLYKKQVEFFNHYINNHKSVSTDFIIKVKADLKFKYFSKLMFVYKKDESRVKTALEILKEGSHKDTKEIFDSSKYFDAITLADFKRPELLNNASFKQCLTSYISNYFIDQNIENFSSEKFLAEKDFILSNFEDELQHYAIARLIDSYNSFSASENVFNLKTLIKEYKHNFSKPSYLDKIEEVEGQLQLIKNTLSEEALNSKIINLKGDTLFVKDVFKNTENNIRTIDFWASWCGPCLNDIIKGHSIRKKLSENNNLEWVYISIDEDKEKWFKKSYELTKYGLTQNQYLLINPKQSKLNFFLGLTSIPRYVVLDKDVLIIDGNAPSPLFENQFLKIIKEINKE